MSTSLRYRLIGLLTAIAGTGWFTVGPVASTGSSVLEAFFSGAIIGTGASLLVTGESPRSWFI